MTISGGEISGATGIGIKSGTLNITGGKISGTFKDTYKEPTSATNGINGDGSAVLVDSYIDYAGSMNINISGNAVLESKVGHAIREIGNDDGKTNVVTLKITDGKFKAGSGMDAVKVRDVTKNTVEISKGIFSSDPSAYCVDEKTGVANTDSGTNREYPFMVGEAGEAPAEVVTAAPKVDMADTLKDNTLAESAASALSAEDSNTQAKVEGATTAAANTIANQNKVDETAAKKALTDAEINVADNQKVNVIVQQYLDIRITDATSDTTDTTTTKTLTLDITPMYRKVATTANPDATDNSEIVVKGIDDQGSGDAKKLPTRSHWNPVN